MRRALSKQKEDTTDPTPNDGRTIPAIGFGTCQVPPKDAARLSRQAQDVTLSADDLATIDAMDDAGGRLGPNPDAL